MIPAHFYFTKKERLSWIILAGLVLAVIFLPGLLLPEKNTNRELKFSVRIIDSLLDARQREVIDSGNAEVPGRQKKGFGKGRGSKSGRKSALPKERKQYREFPFDPNTLPEDSLNLILPRFVASNLVKYRRKGGRFRTPADLERIYGMDSGLFRKVQPFILIPQDEKQEKKRLSYSSETGQKRRAKRQPVLINQADSASFEYLPGIGPVLAARIIAFREALGGFHSVSQVAQTYGLPKETFDRIRPRLILEAAPELIRINEATAGRLAAHPYIAWKEAKGICRYRDHHGAFESVEDLEKVRMLDSGWVSKIEPYLDFRTGTSLEGDTVILPRGKP